MNLNFIKMHGCGNDYIYINCLEEEINITKEQIIKISNRNKGIGSDGVVLIKSSKEADAYMQMFNKDGSEGSMCGNAIRCVAKFVLEYTKSNENNISINTKSGIKEIKCTRDENGKVVEAEVNMGTSSYKNISITILNKTYEAIFVDVGNPHIVIFLSEEESLKELDLTKIGPLFEKSIDGKVNTEFAKIIDENTIEMRVWERGSGETLACGTGACAVVVASGIKNRPIKVKLLGGDLTITNKENLYMKGECIEVYKGSINL